MTAGISENIYRELAGFCTFFLVGAALEAARGMLVFLLAILWRHPLISKLLDITYWIFASIFLIWELFGKNSGVLSGYVPIGIGLGIFAMWRGCTVHVVPFLSERTIKILSSLKKRLKNTAQRAKIKLTIGKKRKD